MKRVVCILVVLLLIAPFSAFATGSQEGGGGSAMADSDGPQYGGTFTYFGYPQANDPGSPSISDANHGSLVWLEPIQERPIQGDVEQYGPRGSGEYAFQLVAYIPPAYQKGHLISDWEINREQMVWTVRDGVTFQAVPGVMESRPLTAADIAADVQAFVDSPWGNRFEGVLAAIRVEGNKVIFEYENYNPGLFYWIGYEDRAIIAPPETIEAGDGQWENQGGTGAFMFEEYVVGSHMSYVKNPDYWDTTEIDGVEYEMPFVDRLMKPIIADEATQIAALRTGAVDWMGVGAQHWDSLEETAPGLERNFYGDMVRALYFDMNEPPWDSVEVRRAVMKGTNFERFREYGNAERFPVHVFPAWPGNPSVYTPMDELPEDLQDLYEYDPDEAMEMLADAGYPNGFSTTFSYDQSSTEVADFAAVLKDEWAKIGIDVEIRPVENATMQRYRSEVDYDGVINVDTQIGNAIAAVTDLLTSDGWLNSSAYANPDVDALAEAIESELDFEAQNALIKEAAVLAAQDVPMLGLYLMPHGDFWWPWVKNYYGEHTIDDGTFGGLKPYIWIDQNLKREMGF